MLTDNLFLISIAVLALLVLFVLGLVLYLASKKPANAKPGADPKIAKIRFDSLRSSFRQAVDLIEGNIVSRAERYSIPWIMLLNEGDDHRQLPIAQSGVASALSTEAASAAAVQGISWQFFDRGVVIDIKGAYLGSPDEDDGTEKPWDEFLGMCRAYRPQRPFDSVVITVPAELLLNDSADSRLELAKRAKMAHRRLWLAQNRFAMRFAVYILVTGTERLEGFGEFARALPEPMRASMLGWSSPYDLATTYQDGWVDEAVGSVVRTVSDASAELFAIDNAMVGAGEILLLPARIEAMRSQLQLYVDEIMRPSAYHEPFFLRGVYLTGDAGELPKALTDPDGLPSDFSATDDDQGAQHDLIAQLSRQPVFLRDLFEKKIFLEYGLTRPSRNQHLARPALHRFTRWTAIIVLGGWSLGLLVATVELHRRNTGLVAALAQLRSDDQYRARAAQRGETIHPSWYRGRALALLAMNEQLRAQVRSSFFMPGSWHVFDDLDERVIDRIEREFGDIAVATMRREMLTRAAQLTGAEQDDVTGEFIVGSDCKTPASFAALAEGPRRETLLVDNLPEFTALQRYLGSVEQFDQALAALDRLRGPGSTGGEADLRLVVRYALGAELPADVGGSVRFFKIAAGESGKPLNVATGPLQDAVRCSFAKGTGRLDARLFAGNGLLVTETALARQMATASTASSDRAGFAKALMDYRGIVAAIKDQETLVASGNGGWMRQSALDLGPAYERMVARVGQIRLLGPEAAEQMRERASSAFQRFRSDFALAFGGAQPGIVWLDKDGRFALSPERIALRDAVTALLAQPFVSAPADHELPTIPPRSFATWDLPRLDQALAVGDVRKRFSGDGLAAFPANLRPGITASLDAQFARIVVSQTADALTPDPTGADSDAAVAAFTAARTRIVKIQAMLTEMGASGQADALGALESRDALERLRALDDTLVKSELYAMSGRDFATWRGEKGPVLAAFSAPDAASLVAYLGQQFARVEALGKQAEVYVAALDPTSAATPLAQRWVGINKELERYKLKNPNSSLLMFEQFLVGPGTEADRTNCAEKLAGKGAGNRTGDYFAERYAQVYNSLFARCVELHFREQQDQWTRFSATFNTAMAGRHPFATALLRDTPVADLGDVGAILRAFEPVSKVFKEAKVDSTTRFQVPGQAARRFVDQFDKVSAFLQPLFPPNEEGAQPGYDIAVEFRTNQANEVEGNQVIDWSLETGGLGLRWRDPTKPLHWEFGQPVTLTLRLAKDSPLVAATDPQQPAMTTDGQTITWRFTDAWALISMIQRQREAEPAMRPEGRSSLLRLEFPLRAATPGDAGAVPREGKARVYLRLMLSPAGKKTPVLWPGLFPTRAPEWALP